ncbi:SDR family NAD(P)-dependent oxidoreductase [Mesotoga sp. H07pep.5.4]|uniref:SDR family NAD(P)-dependent oxidoreductase n=1 Tax=Mesotoga sp. H07pep.5.4 TaxID=1463664 RepID=UPI000EF170AA|nr:SDR family oxidoreductase [Mesotoga sp. H07pep.5.4]
MSKEESVKSNRMNSLQGKVALVTGAAQGIGKAIAERLVDEGAEVVIADVALERASSVARELSIKRKTIAVKADVSSSKDVRELFSVVDREFGRLDILVNNAGILLKGRFEEVTEEMWDRTMAVNLKGPFLCGKEALRLMPKGGRIINITSIDGKVVYYHGHHVPYGVSKAGIIMLTKIMAVELASYGINVNAIAPGVVRTEISAGSMDDPAHLKEITDEIPLGRLASPEEIAGTVVFLSSKDASYLTGSTIYVDGGWTTH